jgi:hypothetical protein
MADRTRRDSAAKLPPRMTPISQFLGRENAEPSPRISSGLGVQQRRSVAGEFYRMISSRTR